jgi:tetratricopeptide (TPR) repeat protein
MVWPRNLAIFYPFDAASFPYWQVAACVLLLLGISVFVVYLGRNQRYLILGWFWFVVTLIPVIGIVQAGSQAYADRYTYVPYIGLFIMLAWGLPQLFSNLPQLKIALGVSIVIVPAALGICAYRQTSYWKNSVTLFSHTIEVTQNNWLGYNNLGVAYDKLDRGADAIEAYKNAIRIKPDDAEAHYNLGVAYGKLGRYQESIEACKQAIEIKPDYAQARNNLGNAYDKLGRFTEAIDAYKQAVKIKPDYAQAHVNLGITYLATGDKNSALAEYNILKLLNPQFANDLLEQINK